MRTQPPGAAATSPQNLTASVILLSGTDFGYENQDFIAACYYLLHKRGARLVSGAGRAIPDVTYPLAASIGKVLGIAPTIADPSKYFHPQPESSKELVDIPYQEPQALRVSGVGRNFSSTLHYTSEAVATSIITEFRHHNFDGLQSYTVPLVGWSRGGYNAFKIAKFIAECDILYAGHQDVNQWRAFQAAEIPENPQTTQVRRHFLPPKHSALVTVHEQGEPDHHRLCRDEMVADLLGEFLHKNGANLYNEESRAEITAFQYPIISI